MRIDTNTVEFFKTLGVVKIDTETLERVSSYYSFFGAFDPKIPGLVKKVLINPEAGFVIVRIPLSKVSQLVMSNGITLIINDEIKDFLRDVGILSFYVVQTNAGVEEVVSGEPVDDDFDAYAVAEEVREKMRIPRADLKIEPVRGHIRIGF